MKYVIRLRALRGRGAGSKAVADACAIAEKLGYIPFYISIFKGSLVPVLKYFVELYDIARLFFRLHNGDTLLLNWPVYFRYMDFFHAAVSRRKICLQILVHDINILRKMSKYADWALRFFALADKVIVHSEPMKQFLVRQGIDGNKISVLTAFDYLTNDKEPRRQARLSDELVYAGNLNKSEFLPKLAQTGCKFTLNCYGVQAKNFRNKRIVYCGSFAPQDVSALNGSWGLVWDGNSADSCCGVAGNYLRYNAPHKLSLYIVAHLPVIVWEESAMAAYVKQQGIGICVRSLKEIDNKIKGISKEDYLRLFENVKKEAKLLRNGEHLRRCLTL